MAIKLISDLHFGHTNLLKFERGLFDTIEEHDDYIIASINKAVKNTDTLYILGDIGNVEKVRQLNGRKVFIMGNHDKRPIKEYEAYFAEVYDKPIFFRKDILLSHEPFPVPLGTLNIHGHLHGSKLSNEQHCNVSAHVIDYKPIDITFFYNYVAKLPKGSEKFLEEWYANEYTFLEPRDDVVSDPNGRILLSETKRLREKLFNNE